MKRFFVSAIERIGPAAETASIVLAFNVAVLSVVAAVVLPNEIDRQACAAASCALFAYWAWSIATARPEPRDVE